MRVPDQTSAVSSKPNRAPNGGAILCRESWPATRSRTVGGRGTGNEAIVSEKTSDDKSGVGVNALASVS
jgi:hypothetical protein